MRLFSLLVLDPKIQNRLMKESRYEMEKRNRLVRALAPASPTICRPPMNRKGRLS